MKRRRAFAYVVWLGSGWLGAGWGGCDSPTPACEAAFCEPAEVVESEPPDLPPLCLGSYCFEDPRLGPLTDVWSAGDGDLWLGSFDGFRTLFVNRLAEGGARWEAPALGVPDDVHVRIVGGTGPNDVFLAAGPSLLHYDGSAVRVTAAEGPLVSAAPLGPDDLATVVVANRGVSFVRYVGGVARRTDLRGLYGRLEPIGDTVWALAGEHGMVALPGGNVLLFGRAEIRNFVNGTIASEPLFVRGHDDGWTPVTTPEGARYVLSAAAFGDDDIWVVAEEPGEPTGLYHFDGAAWSPFADVPVDRLLGGPRPNEVWGLAGGTELYAWDGVAWTLRYTATTGIDSFVAPSPSVAWALDGGALVRFGGRDFEVISAPTLRDYEEVLSIAAPAADPDEVRVLVRTLGSENLVFARDPDGAYRIDPFASPTYGLDQIRAFEPGLAWVFGPGGAFEHTDAGFVRRSFVGGNALPSGITDMVKLPSGETLAIAYLVLYGVEPAGFRPLGRSPGRAFRLVEDELWFEDRLARRTADGTIREYVDFRDRSPAHAFAPSPDAIWAVGDTPGAVRFDGRHFVVERLEGAALASDDVWVWDVTGVDATHVALLVSDTADLGLVPSDRPQRVVFHDGAAITGMVDLPAGFRGVTIRMLQPGEILAVSPELAVIRVQASGAIDELAPPRTDRTAERATLISETDGWSLPMRFDGSTWIEDPSAPPYGDVVASASDDVWASAIGEGVFHFDGATWTRVMPADRPRTLFVAGRDDVIVVDQDGSLSRGGAAGISPLTTRFRALPYHARAPVNVSYVFGTAADDLYFGSGLVAPGVPCFFHFDGAEVAEVPLPTRWTRVRSAGGTTLLDVYDLEAAGSFVLEDTPTGFVERPDLQVLPDAPEVAVSTPWVRTTGDAPHTAAFKFRGSVILMREAGGRP